MESAIDIEFRHAAEICDTAEMSRLLYLISPNMVEDVMRTACIFGRLPVVQFLSTVVRVKSVDLFRAINYGHLEIFKDLLPHVKEEIDFGNLLKCATQRGHLEIIEFLLQHGADVHVESDLPLKLSAQSNRLNIVIRLLEHGATYNPDWKFISPETRQVCETFFIGPKSANKLS